MNILFLSFVYKKLHTASVVSEATIIAILLFKYKFNWSKIILVTRHMLSSSSRKIHFNRRRTIKNTNRFLV